MVLASVAVAVFFPGQYIVAGGLKPPQPRTPPSPLAGAHHNVALVDEPGRLMERTRIPADASGDRSLLPRGQRL